MVIVVSRQPVYVARSQAETASHALDMLQRQFSIDVVDKRGNSTRDRVGVLIANLSEYANPSESGIVPDVMPPVAKSTDLDGSDCRMVAGGIMHIIPTVVVFCCGYCTTDSPQQIDFPETNSEYPWRVRDDS